MKKKLMLITLLMALTIPAPVFAWSSNESDLVKNGFSPEMIRLVTLQKSRMEYTEAIPHKRSRWAQFWWNLAHNDYLAPTYEFGQIVIKY